MIAVLICNHIQYVYSLFSKYKERSFYVIVFDVQKCYIL